MDINKGVSLENDVSASQYDDEIDLRELFAVLLAGKIKIIAVTALFAVGSVFSRGGWLSLCLGGYS